MQLDCVQNASLTPEKHIKCLSVLPRVGVTRYKLKTVCFWPILYIVHDY